MRMLYPLDVHKRTSDAGKLVAKDKSNFIVMMTIIANVAFFFFISTIFKKFLGLGIGWAILVQLILGSIIGSLIFRFWIFDEDEKIREYNGYGSDSFAPYYGMRKDVVDDLDIGLGRTVNIFEYVNGTALAVIRLRYGSNSNEKARETADTFTRIFRTIASYGFEFRTVVMTEDFEYTDEYEALIKRLNGISDTNLSATMLNIAETILKKSHEESNVDVMYLLVRTRTNVQKYDLDTGIKSLVHIMTQGRTAFRSVEFLDKEQLKNFQREYYGLEAMDLSLLKAIKPDMETLEEYMKLVKVCEIEATDGTKFVNKKVIEKHMPSLAKEIDV